MCDYFSQQRIMEGSSSPEEEGCTCHRKGCGKTFFSIFDRNAKGKTPFVCGDGSFCEECRNAVKDEEVKTDE